MERVDATGGASPSPTKSGWDSADVKAYKCIQMIALRKARGIVWMQNQQSVHMARMWCEARDSAGLEGLVQAKDGGVAIPPVVARIFLGDSTSPLTRGGMDARS